MTVTYHTVPHVYPLAISYHNQIVSLFLCHLSMIWELISCISSGAKYLFLKMTYFNLEARVTGQSVSFNLPVSTVNVTARAELDCIRGHGAPLATVQWVTGTQLLAPSHWQRSGWASASTMIWHAGITTVGLAWCATMSALVIYFDGQIVS